MFHVTHPAAGRMAFLVEELERLRAGSLLRAPRPARTGVSLATNDYFGLGRADDETGAPWGATGSRLISGDHPATRSLETTLASWLGVERALVFTSGYAANVGALAALLGPEDVVFSDALNHASLIDGMRLSRATVRVFPHNELRVLEEMLREPHVARRRWVVTESYFSMDADGPDLLALRNLCDASGAFLYLDEAHALGVDGPQGRGLAAACGVTPDVLAGTLGKSLGAQGAFVAGPAPLYDYLWNRARSFVFSTGLSPAVARRAEQNVRRIAPADAERARLAARVRRIRQALDEAGLAPLGHGPVVPVVLGTEQAALAVSERMMEAGFHVQPIRPPTVPPGTSRLRITITLHETDEALDAFVGTLVQAVRSA